MEAKYHLAIRITHWLMAVIIIGLLAVGLVMADMPRGDPLRDTLFSLHKSFGITIFLLFFLRVFLRTRFGAPPLPDVIPLVERKLAHLGHFAFYVFMVIIPVSGFLMVNSFGFAVQFFGIGLPKLIDADRLLSHVFVAFHSYAAYTLIAVIFLHISGALKHYVIEGVNLLNRML